MGQSLLRRDYPNVRARLRISRAGPGLPARERVLTIWMRGTRFRVRDELGSHVSELLDDLPGERGLGTPPRSLEAMMDVWSARQSNRPAGGGPTELFGDLASGEGVVKRGKEEAWPKPARELASLAELILAPEPDARLRVDGQETRLGRAATVYMGRLDGAAAIDVKRVISLPYLLFEEVHDGRNAAHVYVRVIESLDEGIVSDADLIVP